MMDSNHLPACWGNIRWDTSYVNLPKVFYHAQNPTAVAKPQLVAFNAALAQELGLDSTAFESEIGAEVLSGNRLISGSEPIAQAYSGHQFGHFTGLGDGRAILLGEHLTPQNRRVDFHLKVSGPTPFSRRGDGLAALGPMLREFVISEAMHGLGIPTTRSLAVTLTGESVFRDRVLPGAILTRIASSHLRVGTFEHTLALRDRVALQALIHYALNRHYPEAATQLDPALENTALEHALALLRAVVCAQAKLIAQWLSVGFIHGVMNTDNMTISGETIDYGPCAWMDEFNWNQVFSSIDRHGRYAYWEQPKIAIWNLSRFAEALLPIAVGDPAREIPQFQAVIESFSEEFNRHWLQLMSGKLGFSRHEGEDLELIQELLSVMQKHRLDFHSTWLQLTDSVDTQNPGLNLPPLQAWAMRWKERLQRESESTSIIQTRMKPFNPIVIPRNYRVEEALSAAEAGNFDPFWRLVSAVQKPFEDSTAHRALAASPPADREPYQTFCGT